MTISNPFYCRVRQCPMHLGELRCYPSANPVFITTDHDSLCFIRRLKGICLYCAGNLITYDLSFSFERDVWVLYSKRSLLSRTMQLAQAIQLCGANKILVVLINTQLIPKAAYVRRTSSHY